MAFPDSCYSCEPVLEVPSSAETFHHWSSWLDQARIPLNANNYVQGIVQYQHDYDYVSELETCVVTFNSKVCENINDQRFALLLAHPPPPSQLVI